MDKDGNGTVSLKYQIDTYSEQLLKEYTIKNTNRYEVNCNITLSDDLAEGNHSITLYGIDSNGRKSNNITINFTYFSENPYFYVGLYKI